MQGGTTTWDGEVTVTVVKDGDGYGMKVSGDNPVYVQSVKEHGAAWRAGLRAGDRLLRVDGVPVHRHTHQQVVHMIRANPTTVLTVLQHSARHKTPITAPVPVNSEKQRQLEASKLCTMRLMLDNEQKYISDLRKEMLIVPDLRKQAELESAEQRCSILQHEIDSMANGQRSPGTPRLAPRPRLSADCTSPPAPAPAPAPAGFLSGLPRSLSNLTGQSLRNLRQGKHNKQPLEAPSPPIVPTTCLDNTATTPPPLPPRSIERPKRGPSHSYYKPYAGGDRVRSPMRRSAHSLDGGGGGGGEVEGPQPNSIALQMSYPLVNVPPPPLKTDTRTGVPVLHVRSQSSPEHLEHSAHTTSAGAAPPACCPCSPPPPPPPPPAPQPPAEPWERSPPPGTPPPPYARNTQPCADPQRSIISMEEDDCPSPDNATHSGLFSNLLSVRESRARTAILLNWLLGERRCASANLLLLITDSYRAATGVTAATLRRWAYEIHSTFLMPRAVLQLSGVDENMANEIDQVLVNEYEKEELLRNVFRKARQKAKEELTQQLTEFQVKRQVGLGGMYMPEDELVLRCDVDKAQEQIVVERLMTPRLSSAAEAAGGAPAPGSGGGAGPCDARAALLAALIAAALALQCREADALAVRKRWWHSPKTKSKKKQAKQAKQATPATVAAAVGGARAAFLLRDKPYKQRLKQLAKQNPQPFIVRGHHLQLQALTSVAHCHRCEHAIWGLAPQAYVCTECQLRVHRSCARGVEEPCCLDAAAADHHNNRISRFIDRIHPAQTHHANNDSNERKSKKSSNTAHFLNMERSFRKMEDEPPWEQSQAPAHVQERRDESDESLYESADCHSDAISASDDALPRLSKTPTISKESLKVAVTDEEVDVTRVKKGHRKTMSLSHPLELVKNFDEWFESSKKDLKKSRESLWSEEDRDSINGSNAKLDQVRKNSKNEEKMLSNSRKSSTVDNPKVRKSSKGSSVGALSFLRRKKTPTSNARQSVEVVMEDVDKILTTDEVLSYTKFFLEAEKRHCTITEFKLPVDTDSEDEQPAPKPTEHRRRLSRQTSRSKSKVRGKSQSVKVNTLRKSHSGTLKKGKKKNSRTPMIGRSRQSSIVESTPLVKKKNSDAHKQNSWLFSATRGESKREGSTEESAAPDGEGETADVGNKEVADKDNNWRPGTGAPVAGTGGGGGRGVNRAESCRERDAPRRGKHRNASDPNRLTAHHNHDLEPGAATAPSGSSSSSSLSSRSNESNTVVAEHQASQPEWSDEDEPLAAQWADSLPPQVLESLSLSARMRKRQEVIHELIVSEGSHLRWLKVLSFVFLRSLEAQPALLPPEELRALFPNLPPVRERHARLYADLRAARSDAPNHVVETRPIADAILNSLGDAGYASCLSRFCRGQRMALEALRERRRKHKELNQFLAAREQHPLCGRLQLRDLLACVWQRLTKYQLLLESIMKTFTDEECEAEGEESDAGRMRQALGVAKRVLNAVDAAIRCAENEHRLRSIQSKLEVRAGGAEGEELRRLELAARRLRLEGELTVRCDANKRVHVLALMFTDCLVLLQREGDKFVLKPMSVSSNSAGGLSPVIKWEKTLFRPNAAVRNTFFLITMNGYQMHELTANSAAEYATWVKHIQEAPLAKLTEAKPGAPGAPSAAAPSPHPAHPSHQPSRSNDDSGINVSRNPSDASEKSSASTLPADEREGGDERPDEGVALGGPGGDAEREVEGEREGERERDKPPSSGAGDGDGEGEGEVVEREERHKPRRPTLGRPSQHPEAPPPLEPPAALTVRPPAAHGVHVAQRVYSQHARLRQLDGEVSRALRAKSALVAELLGMPSGSYGHLADLAVAETLGQVDVKGELRAARLDRSTSTDTDTEPEGGDSEGEGDDVHQLLLAAQAQANQLTEMLSRVLSVSEAGAVSARAGGGPTGGAGRCGACRRRGGARGENTESVDQLSACDAPPAPPGPPGASVASGASVPSVPSVASVASDATLEKEVSFDMLSELDDSRPLDDDWEGPVSGAVLAARLAGVACGLQRALSRLLDAAPRRELERRDLRRRLAAARERDDARAHRAHTQYQMTEDFSYPKEYVDHAIPDQPSNGG